MKKIVIDMNSGDEVPQNVIESIKGKDINVTFAINDKIKWTVNGLSITDPHNVDLGVKINSGTDIPSKLIAEVGGENETIQFSLDYSGDFGFEAILTLTLGEKYNGKYVNLYYYNPDTGKLEFICSGAVTNGKADLLFTHASDYVIVVGNEKYEDVSAAAGMTANSSPIDFSEVAGNRINIPAFNIPCTPVYSSKKRRYRILRKSKLNDLVFVY